MSVAPGASRADEPTVSVELTLEETGWLLHSLLQANPAYVEATLTGKAPAELHPMLDRMLALHLKLGAANDKLMGKEPRT